MIVSLVTSVNECFKTITQVEDAKNCLQAHYSGLSLNEDTIKHLQDILVANPLTTSSSSMYQIAVALVLTRLGYSPKLEVPIFNGVVKTDIVVKMNKTGVDGEGGGGGEESGGGIEKVLITLDEQSHF